MKQIKKLASLLLAAVLAMTLLAGCGGRGGNVDIAITEQSLLKYINKTRANAEMGLSPVKNDPTWPMRQPSCWRSFPRRR